MYQTIENELQGLLAEYGVSLVGEDNLLVESLEGTGARAARGCFPGCSNCGADIR
jgi:hypothetical protein